MFDACDIQKHRVRTQSGKLLGHAHDVRCAHRGTHAEITQLVYGHRGLVERLGFREASHDTLPWSRVIEIRNREIIVEDGIS
jgi:hypothetical protein